MMLCLKSKVVVKVKLVLILLLITRLGNGRVTVTVSSAKLWNNVNINAVLVNCFRLQRNLLGVSFGQTMGCSNDKSVGRLSTNFNSLKDCLLPTVYNLGVRSFITIGNLFANVNFRLNFELVLNRFI